MNTKYLIAAAVTAALAHPVCGQVTRPTTAPSQLVADADVAGIQFRTIPAVLDARERRQDWHEAALQAESRVREPKLRDQLVQRLAGIAPYVARSLVKHPQDDALVSVLVYRQPGEEDKQAMVAVTFDGLGSELGGSFFADVLSDWPQAPQINPTSAVRLSKRLRRFANAVFG